MDVVRPAVVLGLALFTSGCSQHRGTGSDTPADRTAAQSIASIERLSTRSRVIADGVELRATLWTPALVRAGSSAMGGPSKTKSLRHRRWQQRYTAGTSFTVVVDVARRRPDSAQDDAPLLDARHWHFRLGDTSAAPDRVELVAVDRFPTEAGGHHQRLVFEAHFGDVPPEPQLVLAVRCDAPHGRRLALGRWMANRGVELTWSLTEVQAKLRTTDHLGV